MATGASKQKDSRLDPLLWGRGSALSYSRLTLDSLGSAACRKAVGFLPRPRREGRTADGEPHWPMANDFLTPSEPMACSGLCSGCRDERVDKRSWCSDNNAEDASGADGPGPQLCGGITTDSGLGVRRARPVAHGRPKECRPSGWTAQRSPPNYGPRPSRRTGTAAGR